MDEKLLSKLKFKAGIKALIINPPDEFSNIAGAMQFDTKPILGLGEYDFLQYFVSNLVEFREFSEVFIKYLKFDGILWACYPKGKSKIKSDVNRDILRINFLEFGMETVAMVSIDEIWSALRARPEKRG